MEPINERKKYLLERNKIAKQRLTENLSNLELTDYLIPDILTNDKGNSSPLINSLKALSQYTHYFSFGSISKLINWALQLKKTLSKN